MEYTLENECLRVGFSSYGGELRSIQDCDGVEYLWQRDAEYWGGTAPVLFPICGSLKNGRAVTKDNRTIQMPRHGIVRKREFSYTASDADSIAFSIESDEEMYRQYPYRFCLTVRYLLSGRQITAEYTVENKGEIEMPFFIGAHPGFNCPLYSGEVYEDYKIIFEQKEDCTVPRPVTESGLTDMGCRTKFLNRQKELALSHSLFAKDAVILDSLKSRSVTLCSKNHAKGVKIDFHDFPYLILWSSQNGGPFVAIEPWAGLSDCSDEGGCFEEKRNVQTAGPKEKRKYCYTITIL